MMEATESPPPDIATCILRIRGLPYNCTEDDVAMFFGEFNVPRRDIYVVQHGPCRGDGYVRFSDPTTCETARQKLHRKHIGERYVELYPSSESALQSARQQSEYSASNCFLLRLRGLPFHCEERHIFEFLSDVPQSDILSVEICMTYDGRSTGDAFIHVANPDAFTKVMGHNRHLIGQRYIEIFESNVREKEAWMNSPRGGRGRGRGGALWLRGNGQGMPAAGMGVAGRGGGVQGMRGGFGPYASTQGMPSPLQLMMMMQQQQGGGGAPHTPGRYVIRVRGLPFSATESDIANFFHDVNIPAQGVHMVYNAQGRLTGEAFVEVLSEQDVLRALDHKGMAMGRRYIEVFRSSVQDMQTLAGGVPGADGNVDPMAMMMMMSSGWMNNLMLQQQQQQQPPPQQPQAPPQWQQPAHPQGPMPGLHNHQFSNPGGYSGHAMPYARK